MFSSPVVVSLGAPRSSSFVWEQKTLPRPKAGREILEQAVNLRGRPSDTHLLLHSWERGKGKLVMGFFCFFNKTCMILIEIFQSNGVIAKQEAVAAVGDGFPTSSKPRSLDGITD